MFLFNDSLSFPFIPSFLTQRVNQCLRDACHKSGIQPCVDFIDCGHGDDFKAFSSNPNWTIWKNNETASACLTSDGFPYGIYIQAVNLTTERSIITRYTYSLFWGFQVLLLSLFIFAVYVRLKCAVLIQVEFCFV
jgi:hypothetical protein